MNCKLIKQLIIVSYKFTTTSATPDVAWFLLIYCGTLLQLSSSVTFPDAEWSFAYSNIPFTLSSCSLCLLLALGKELPRHCESLGDSLVHRRGALPLIPVPLPNIFPPSGGGNTVHGTWGQFSADFNKERLSKSALRSDHRVTSHGEHACQGVE